MSRSLPARSFSPNSGPRAVAPSPSGPRHAAPVPADQVTEHPAWCSPLGCNAGTVHVEDVCHVGDPLYHHVDDGNVELSLARCQAYEEAPAYLFTVRRTATTWIGEMPLTDADIDWLIEARARIRARDVSPSVDPQDVDPGDTAPENASTSTD